MPGQSVLAKSKMVRHFYIWSDIIQTYYLGKSEQFSTFSVFMSVCVSIDIYLSITKGYPRHRTIRCHYFHFKRKCSCKAINMKDEIAKQYLKNCFQFKKCVHASD